jgi:hypothetical protein
MDRADLTGLLWQFPELKVTEGSVADALRRSGASAAAFDAWRDVVAEDIQAEDEDAGY